MNTKSLDQFKDKYYGAVGSTERDSIDRDLNALHIGLFIKD